MIFRSNGHNMDIKFKTNKLCKKCSSKKEMVKEWGPELAQRLSQRLMEIQAMGSIGELRCLPQARCHQLTGDRDNQFAVDLKHPYRLIFEPYHDPVPLKSDGGFDLFKITAILILEVVDYHGN